MKWSNRSLLAILAVALALAVFVTAESAEVETEFDVALPAEASASAMVESMADRRRGGASRAPHRAPPRGRHHARRGPHRHHRRAPAGRHRRRGILRRRHHRRRRGGIFRRLRRRLSRRARKAARKAAHKARKAAVLARHKARKAAHAARRKAKKARKAALRAARRRGLSRRAIRKIKHNARKVARVSKKVAKKIAAATAITTLANNMKKAKSKSRQAMLKSSKKIKELAKKFKISAAKVRKALKSPKSMLKKAKHSVKKAKLTLKKALAKSKKAANKVTKKAGKSGKFQPKGINMKKTPLTKKLKKVVEEEPESAAITKAKNNWAWEDNVVKRLDTFVPPDPKNIKNRIGTFESEADAACNEAEVRCVQHKFEHPVNGKTCRKAQKACFHAKVALRVINEASVACVEAQVPCSRKDWQSKGKCMVAKAKCKRLLHAADYQYDQTHKIAKKVRDAHFNDEEANLAIDTVNRQSVEVRKAQADHDEAEPKAMKCAETISTATTCELNMDESPKCVQAQKDMTLCKAVVKDFRKLQKNLKKQLKRVDFVISRRNAAQAEAKIGAAF